MSGLRIVNFVSERAPRAGVVQGEHVIDVATLTGQEAYASIGNLMRGWDVALRAIEDALAGDVPAGVPLADVQLRAPIRHGASIFGAGANYYGHSLEMAELAGRPAPEDPKVAGHAPWHFLKAPSTVVGQSAAVERPPLAPETLDWEVELAVVIGKTARNVSVEAAMDYVAGYTVGNDLSARGLLWREGMHATSPFRSDWVLHKNFPGSTPLGPWLVPASEIPDPQQLMLKLSVNGKQMQSDSTSDMIFSVAEQIAHLSRAVGLTPGDVIMTGTPGGNAAFHNRYLQPGDHIEAWVERIGTLETDIV